ncbi:MAG TPA: hypothetical protein DCE44_04685 [Verrucomicrobiales bacterium]|nr:hypothetical protein [Verrucomicrobiales bacterium]
MAIESLTASTPMPSLLGVVQLQSFKEPVARFTSRPPANEIVGPTAPSFELAAQWGAQDRLQRKSDIWDKFWRNWVDPLLTESDGWSFYDPTEDRPRAPLPVNLPRAFGAGVQFRASF